MPRRSTGDAGPRLLWWVPEFPPDPGGIGTFAATITPLLGRRGYVPTVLVGQGGPERCEHDGVELIREPIRSAFEQGDVLEVAKARRTLIALKTETRPDLYHLSPCEPSPMLHLATLATAPAPTVLTIHLDLVPPFDFVDDESVFVRLAHASTIITACSTDIALQFARRRPDLNHRLVSIPNAVHVDAVSPAPPPAAAPTAGTLVAVGRLEPQKGFDRLIRAMPMLLSRRPDARLHVLGEGSARPELEALISETGVGDAVDLEGHVDRDDVRARLGSAHVVIAPSRFEGLPFAVLEAAAAGRPIVGTRTGGTDRVVDDGVTGILLDQDLLDADPAVLADAIVGLLDDPARAEQMGRAGRQRVIDHFGVDTAVSRFEHVYRTARRDPVDVAIVIPVRNAERTVAATLESVLADVESSDLTTQIVVVDDGSTDATAEIVGRYRSRSVELFGQDPLGGSMARNAGIALTSSRYVAHFDGDDIWPPGRLGALLARIDGDDDLDIVFGHCTEFADDSAPDSVAWSPDPVPVRMVTAGLVRRAVYDRIGGFSSTTSYDLVEWMARAVDLGVRFDFIDDVTMQRRIHADNMSHAARAGGSATPVALLKQLLDRRRAAAET